MESTKTEVFVAVLRSGPLRRALLAYFCFRTAELATWLAILVWAFERGGADTAGLVALVQLVPAALGALAAGLLVVGGGVAVRQPLARVPENTLKFAVGVLLSAFGVFWIGEGLRYPWPGDDLAIVILVAGFLVVALVAVRLARASSARRGLA